MQLQGPLSPSWGRLILVSFNEHSAIADIPTLKTSIYSQLLSIITLIKNITVAINIEDYSNDVLFVIIVILFDIF